MKTYEIKEYVTEDGNCPFREWIERLDTSAKARIQARVFRFKLGNLGDHKLLGPGVYEARFDFGPGYRLYFGIEGKKVILLLIGGDKKSQTKDIAKAKSFWIQWKEG
jgi:putative addiction module killer protein